MNHKANVLILALFVLVVSLAGYFNSALFFTAVYMEMGLSLYFFYSLLRNPLNINSFDFFNIALCLGFLFAPGLVIIKSTPFLRQMGPLVVGPFAYTGYSQSLSLTYATLVTSFLVLFMVKFPLITDETRKHLVSLQYFSNSTLTDYVFIIAMTLLIAYAFHTGELGFDGIQPLAINLGPGQFVRTTTIGQVSGHALPALVPTIAAIFLLEKNKKKKVFLGLMLMINFGFLITTGRRQIIFSALVTIAMYFILKGKAVASLYTIDFKRYFRLFVALALIGSLVFGASLVFYAMRVAAYRLGPVGTQISLVDRLTGAIQILEHPAETGFFKRAKTEGAVRPATLLGYIAALQSATQQNYMYGQCLASNILTDVPTAIWAGKNRFVNVTYPCQDDDVNKRFGLPLVDSPGTAQSYGYADFGLSGLLIYPLLCAILVGFALNILMRARQFSFKIFTFSMAAFYSAFAETSITAYFDCFRSIAVIYLCVLGYELFVFGVGRRLAKRDLPIIPIIPLNYES